MKITVQYIPLSKIHPVKSDIPMTSSLRKLRTYMLDCMHLLVVRKNQKDGSYTLISGFDRYVYLNKHSNQKLAPCIVEDKKRSGRGKEKSWFQRWRNRSVQKHIPSKYASRMTPVSWSILRTFFKQERRRYKQLSRSQQLKVLTLGIRHKRTVLRSMKSEIDKMLSK
ncbi:hypothetical protein [Marinicrinis lubricantis]|uniref:ParB/Sulfiredoxin domain-containing protein n=1 Tax=Marinicrinis lubricantis TaxID=2086470 RepID=A0ABW1IJW3_9BACL